MAEDWSGRVIVSQRQWLSREQGSRSDLIRWDLIQMRDSMTKLALCQVLGVVCRGFQRQCRQLSASKSPYGAAVFAAWCWFSLCGWMWQNVAAVGPLSKRWAHYWAVGETSRSLCIWSGKQLGCMWCCLMIWTNCIILIDEFSWKSSFGCLAVFLVQDRAKTEQWKGSVC